MFTISDFRRRLLLSAVFCSAVAMTAQAQTQAPQSQVAQNQPASGSVQTSVAGNTLKVEEVVVTAQMHNGTVQTTAASIAAVTADDLENRGITSLADLAQATPGVSLKSEGPSQTEIEMRGMTSSGGNSPTVGFYIDDVPLSGPAGAQNGHVIIDPSLYDLNRVEVLRGPQGTLYGASSMGGTVKLVTNKPDASAFAASAESTLSGTDGGSFNHADNLMVNLPIISDQLALRVVGTENYTSGWINRIVSNSFPVVNYNSATAVATRGDVQDAPVSADHPGSNAYQLYSARVSMAWTPTANLTITPSYFYETSKQDGISAYDSAPGFKNAHYQPFDIAEPLTDQISIASLSMNYNFEDFTVTSNTSEWWRRSTQVEDASEAFNNPNSGATYAVNYGLPAPGYYGPNGTGEEYGKEIDPSRQFTQELRFTSKDGGPLTWVGGVYYSNFYSLWTFNGTTPNYGVYMDLGTFAPATTPNWFDANEPSSTKQTAVFGDATYAFTDKLKGEVGLRWNSYDYNFSACISGWGSGRGAATPDCTGQIRLEQYNISPKFNLSYTFDEDLMVYVNVANGSRPGGGNAEYPTTGAIWGPAFAAYNYGTSSWPTSYKPDKVWSYEAGEKARFLNGRLIVDASVYYEDWTNIQLETYPDDWALNINGNYAKIYGADIDATAILGNGFQLKGSAGYLHEYLNGGPHWLIAPVDKLPDITPVQGDLILSYATDLTDKYSFTAQLESNYYGEHYSIAFGNGFETNGQYIKLPGYELTNIRFGIQSTDNWTASVFVNNLTNTHAQLESMFAENEPTSAYNRIMTNQPLTAGIDLTYRTN